MATQREDPSPPGESGENRRTPVEKRDIGAPTLGQSEEERLPPNPRLSDRDTIPGDHRPDPDKQETPIPPGPEKGQRHRPARRGATASAGRTTASGAATGVVG